MSCCAPGTESALDFARTTHAVPSSEELMLASRSLGKGLRQTDLSVPAVHCGTCITTIEQALNAMPVVERARVNLSTRRVSIVWREMNDERATNPQDLIATIHMATGYDAHLFMNDEEASDRLRTQLLRGVAVTGFAAANIMLLSVSVWSGAEAATRDLFHWISAMIAAPALIYGGRFFYASAWNALKRGRTNMDVPIALAITLSYCISLWETMHHGEHAWFDATASLLFFLLIGRTLDHLMRDRARSAITGLARLSPRGAMVLGADGVREYRPVEEIVPGDRISVAAGERLAVDGVVELGESELDVSIVNGESVPQPVRPGTEVRAGTINLTGSLVIRSTATARDSFLAEIVSLMEAAEGGRARYRRIADRAAQIYSPAVHLLALVSFLAWGLAGGDWMRALLIAISVLIITCPCALGLAVPVVQVVAAGRLFRSGIMVKDGSGMERLAEIDSVVFDKTGTLTLGRPRVRQASGKPADQAMAAAMAAHSRHPLSQALHASHSGPLPLIGSVREYPGEGFLVSTGAGEYRLGKRSFACANKLDKPVSGSASEVVLSLNGDERAQFLLEDAVRTDAEIAMDRLHSMGLSTAILSGDRLPVVAAMGRRLGIANWKASLTPREKAGICTGLATEGRKVLMVGDGINDAPALSTAHVSMAPATAADIGRQAADFVFMHDSLLAVPLAIEISRRAGRLIRENFALAIGYNIIAVPIALAGMATPLIASVAMSTSSIIVVANALRLNRMLQNDGQASRDQPKQTVEAPTSKARLA